MEDKAGPTDYHARIRAVAVWSAVLVAVLTLLLVPWFRLPSLAFAAGGVCGILNTLLVAWSTQRLARSGSAGGFVLSSFLRIAVFGIVPVAFAATGPWWSMVWYFGGFFLPLALYAASVSRAFKRE